MDVNAVQKLALSTEKISQDMAEPHPDQVAMFNQMMNPTTPPSAGETIVSSIQQQGVQIESALQHLKVESMHQLTPERMLTTQLNIVQSVVMVELVAKTAGSAAQSINKLTSMQ